MNEVVLAVHRRFGHRSDEIGVDKVDLTRRVGPWAEVTTPRGRAWFAFDGRGLTELQPSTDPALPLAAHWDELLRRGAVDVLSYRPGRRVTLRVHRAVGPVILKGYRRGKLNEAVCRHENVVDSTRSLTLRGPELVRRDDDAAAIELEDLGGRPFDVARASSKRFLELGSALRAFQERPGAEVLPEHTDRDELDVLDRAAEKAVRLTGSLPLGWSTLRDRLELGASRAADAVRTHRDLHDKQLLELPGLAWLDFDLACRADPALDAANLTAHLDLRALQQVPGVTLEGAWAASRALREGLGRDGEDGFALRFERLRAATFLRLALVYRLRPRWAHLSGALIDRARSCVEGNSRALA